MNMFQEQAKIRNLLQLSGDHCQNATEQKKNQ